MSLKTVELQIAIPRTQDAGKIQSEQEIKANNDFNGLNIIQQKEEEKLRTTVSKNEKMYKMENKNILDERSSQDTNQTKSDKRNKKDRKRNHPYKGIWIDSHC